MLELVEAARQVLRPGRIRGQSRAPASQPEAAIWLGDTALALYRLPADADAQVRSGGPLPCVPRVHLMALRVRDLGRARELLAREGARTLREDRERGELVTHPADTQGLLIAWARHELPRDPRSALAESIECAGSV